MGSAVAWVHQSRPGLFLTNAIYLPVYVIGAVGGMASRNDTRATTPGARLYVLLWVQLMARGLQDVPRSKGFALLVLVGAVAAASFGLLAT